MQSPIVWNREESGNIFKLISEFNILYLIFIILRNIEPRTRNIEIILECILDSHK